MKNKKQSLLARKCGNAMFSGFGVAVALVLGVCAFNPSAQAQRYGHGNGGEGLELRMENIKSEIRNWILATEFKDLNLGGQDAKTLADLVLKSMAQSKLSLTDQVLTIGGKERACINYPQTQTIECNRAKLTAETDENLYPLMLHEYMGLAGLEQNQGLESDYQYSKQARDFVEYKMVAKLGVIRKGAGPGRGTMQFVWLQGGTFTMGQIVEDPKEHRLHSVTLSPFEIQTTEVTQRQYVEVMGNNPSAFKIRSHCPGEYQEMVNKYGAKVGLCPNHPVETVSWTEATAFAKQLTQAAGDGYRYRLPTEAEWEFAARSGTGADFSFGNDASQLGDYAWFSKNTGPQTHAVGGKRSNAYGLYDMHGNVWEWVHDWYDSSYYQDGQVNPTGPFVGWRRVLRGGSWNDDAQYCRSAFRYSTVPVFGYSHVGFRLVRTR